MNRSIRRAALALVFALAIRLPAAEPSHQAELIFPLEPWHNHGSCIVECPNGDLLACWFHGSGERKSDDVAILGARWVKGKGAWTEPFVMADTPGFPDTNCCMIIDPKERLWLLWPTIQDNNWEGALMKWRISSDYMKAEGPPKWDWQDVLHTKPADNFKQQVETKTKEYLEGMPQGARAMATLWSNRNIKMAGEKLTSRLGWFTRAHPYIIDNRRMVVGLYSDGFSFSMCAITDDWGEHWTMGEPMVGGGNIQPSFARKKDGTLVAYMRDNGPPPKRVMACESKDEGMTWSKVYDHATLPNPGAGLEVMNLADGRFAVIYNDLQEGRHSLAVSISDDEGATYKWTRHLEREKKDGGSFHYPSMIQAKDGSLHASYSYFLPKGGPDGKEGKSIKHAHFNAEWVEAGDAKE